jgi:hypothetical protein
METPIKWKDLDNSLPPIKKPVWIWDGQVAWTAKLRKGSNGMNWIFDFVKESGEKPPKFFTHWCEIPKGKKRK